MEHNRIWLSSPHMGELEKEFVNAAFETNWIAPLGPNVDNFEKELQDFNKVDHVAALSSGTAALHLALILNNVEEGDYVLVQSFTFSATVNPIRYLKAIPVLVDSEKESWNMDPVALEQAIISCIEGKDLMGDRGLKIKGKLPKAIVPVHLYGMPANMNEILKLGEKYNIPVIEDAAESLGSKYKGQFTGTLGKMGIYSFNGNKIITTSGGGALVSNNKELVNKARFLATQARDEAPHYQHSEIGYNYRMSNILAGIGRGQMKVLNTRINQRRKNFNRYHQYFSDWNSIRYNIGFQEEDDTQFSNRWLSCIIVDPELNNGLTAEKIRLALGAENIESRPLWKPMHLQPIFEDFPFFGDGTSEGLFERGLCLPSGSNLTDIEFDRIFRILDKMFEKA